jgi:hypothetical protein
MMEALWFFQNVSTYIPFNTMLYPTRLESSKWSLHLQITNGYKRHADIRMLKASHSLENEKEADKNHP